MGRKKDECAARPWSSIRISRQNHLWLCAVRSTLGLYFQDMLELALRIGLSSVGPSGLEIKEGTGSDGWKQARVLSMIHVACREVGGWKKLQDTYSALLDIAKPIVSDMDALIVELEKFTDLPAGDKFTAQMDDLRLRGLQLAMKDLEEQEGVG